MKKKNIGRREEVESADKLVDKRFEYELHQHLEKRNCFILLCKARIQAYVFDLNGHELIIRFVSY